MPQEGLGGLPRLLERDSNPAFLKGNKARDMEIIFMYSFLMKLATGGKWKTSALLLLLLLLILILYEAVKTAPR